MPTTGHDEKSVQQKIKKTPAANLLSAAINQIVKVQQLVMGSRKNIESRLANFEPKNRLLIERGNFIVKTVESSWELEAALRLRHKVFFRELQGERRDSIDIDKFDPLCDHLIVLDKEKRCCVGTYRLLSTTFSDIFYSSTEFDIREFMALPGNKLEVGRACIDRDYRSGLVIALLWKGIIQYANNVEARYIFGCSSVSTVNPVDVYAMMTGLKNGGHMADNLNLPPRLFYRFRRFNFKKEPVPFEAPAHDALANLPSLLLTYLKMGAKVGREPALDRAFNCTDFFTILETEKMSPSFQRKLNLAEPLP